MSIRIISRHLYLQKNVLWVTPRVSHLSCYLNSDPTSVFWLMLVHVYVFLYLSVLKSCHRFPLLCNGKTFSVLFLRLTTRTMMSLVSLLLSSVSSQYHANVEKFQLTHSFCSCTITFKVAVGGSERSVFGRLMHWNWGIRLEPLFYSGLGTPF